MPDRWLFVTVSSPSALELDLLAEGLIAAGANGVEQQGDVISTYLPPPPDTSAFITELEHGLAARIGRGVTLHWEWRADADWASEWRRGLAPRRCGEHIIVTPSWIVPDASPDDIVITIDPQMAFGTGEHATTRSVLRLAELAVRPGDRVLDVGTGSGILAIAAVQLGAQHAVGVESDADALINAAENLAANGVADRVELVHGLVDETYLSARPAAFDLILANVLSGVLRPLLPSFHRALVPAGRLILSGILQSEAEFMREAATAAGFAVVREEREEEWWSVLLHRS